MSRSRAPRRRAANSQHYRVRPQPPRPSSRDVIVRKVFVEQIPQAVRVILGRDAEWDASLEGH
jgi:hypothetical protein